MSRAAPGSLGGYEVLYELKSGGMGDVLLARKRGAGGFERLVAIKTIKSELRGKAELRAMFLDEAKLLARLGHPCIAQVFDFGEEPDGSLYLAMEYVPGVRFTELARRALPPSIAARAMAQVCRGLHAAHELTDLAGNPLGVVHRDVTPENLMLTFEGRVKVLDFGIALVRGRSAPVTEYGTIKGKPPYLSPEQVKNQPVDRRTDIFSAAVVLHELLTGEPVYQGESVYAIARAIETDEVAPPSAEVGELPDGLDEVVMTGMQRDPEARFQNALAMAEALERVANKAGGESLEGYARRELAAEAADHRRWLRGVVEAGGGGARSPIGRPSGVVTAVGDEAIAAEVAFSSPVKAAGKGAVSDDPGQSTEEEVRLLRATGGHRGRWLLLALLLIAGGVAGVLVLAGSDDRPVAAAPPDGGIALAELDPIDAAPAIPRPAPVDAAALPPPEPRVVRRDPKPRDPPRPDPARKGINDRQSPPDAAAPPPPPQPAGSGTVTIAADPYAIVRIDGVEVGTTPIFNRVIAAGRHEIVLIHPDSGAVRLRRTVDVADGEHEKVIAR